MALAPGGLERAVVQEALRRGFLTHDQLREALLLQEELRAGGRSAPLLGVLRGRWFTARQVEELQRFLQERDGTLGDVTPTEVELPWAPAEVSPELLERSQQRAREAPEQDPEDVRRFLEACFETTIQQPAGAPGAPAAAAPSPPEAAAVGQRQQVVASLRDALREDPQFAPHAELVLDRLETLGEGGMGVVYRVRDGRLGRQAALKLIRPERGGEDAVARFRREVEITARLDHPSIPPVYEAGTTATGEHFLLMKVIEGQPLSRRIKALHDGGHPAASEERALLEALVKVGEALGYAHSQGVVHRDLKPGNVMLGQFGEVMVMDWGLARELARGDEQDEPLLRSASGVRDQPAPMPGEDGELTQAGTVLGTPGYMPPEQAEGRFVDPRADVFALGAVLTCVLTGRPPIEGASPVNKLYATIEGRVVLPRDRRPDVPRELHAIAARALASDPRERYPTADAFVADLRAHLAGEEVRAHRYGMAERLQRAARRHPSLLIALSLGLVASLSISAALGLAAQQRLRAEHQRLRAEQEQTRAEEQRRQARALAAEQARSLAYTDGGRLKLLLREIRDLGPRSRDVPALEAWLSEARALLTEERRGRHRARERELADVKAPTAVERAELEALQQLFGDLQILARRPKPGEWPQADSVAGVEACLALAQEIQARTITGAENRRTWAEAARAVAADPRYEGLRLAPIEGLVPIGCDPASGLQELWHVPSGERPERGRDGRLRLTERSGLVLVLIPPGPVVGRFAQAEREVRQEAFLLSKYEMTQGQWLRLTGDDPSEFRVGFMQRGRRFTRLHPVEQVSWEECRDVLGRLGLALPSEVQWEYACRAGSAAAWWTGDDPRSLIGAANVADQTFGAASRRPHEPWRDGHALHAPVGSFRANPFGLHDVVGNVFEWVQDRWWTAAEATEVPAHIAGSYRVMRGGCWATVASGGRSSHRSGKSLAYRGGDVGVRPARDLAP